MTKHEAGQRLAMNTLDDILNTYIDDKIIDSVKVDDIELALYFLENKRSKTIHIYICDYSEEILNRIILSKDDDENICKAKVLLENLLQIKSKFKAWG